jgi:hypothetical protein
MEANKEAALKCRALAEKYLNEGNKAKCLQLCEKAERLAGGSLAGVDRLRTLASASSQRTPARASTGAARPTPATPATATPVKAAYTPQQVEAVKEVIATKRQGHYAVLGIQKRATDDEIKKAYRKLALKFHPDKNRAPHAEEAFKCIGLAFATLSDRDKRRHYDTYGDDEPEQGMPNMRRRRPPGGGVYADEMSPEDIFNVFFGGGYPQQHVRRRPAQRRAAPPQNMYQQLAQFVPILLLVLLTGFGNSGSLLREPAFSLKRTAKYRHERLTKSRGVVRDVRYFVADGFSAQHARDMYGLKRQEMNVASEYQTQLRYACFGAKQRVRTLENHAYSTFQAARRRDYLERAKNVDESDCALLQEVFGIQM